ncbi:hypothetical protein MBGDN05_00796, partial [Thermoplasmatales archaeon SCGC AB-539-N05]
MGGMKKEKTSVKILLIFCFVLIPLLISFLPASGAVYIKEVGFKEQQHLPIASNPMLTAGNFQYLDITLTDNAHKISIVAYLGNKVPDVENRSIKNYYRWEYDNGKWQDKSGYKSLYINPSRCEKNGQIYSFYVRLDAKTDTGDWTIKVFVDNETVYSNLIHIKVVNFPFLLFALCADGFKVDKNDVLQKFFKRHRTVGNQQELITDEVFIEDNAEELTDRLLSVHSSASQNKILAVPVEKNSFYDELVDKVIEHHSS